MPIKRIYADSTHSLFLEQVCGNPRCKKTNTIGLNELSLGFGQNHTQIALPACAACGSNECLIQTFDEAPAGMAAHRKSVNALAAHLKTKRQITSEHAEAITADKRVSPDMGVLLASVEPLVGP